MAWLQYLETLLVLDDETVDRSDCAHHQRLDVPEQLVHSLPPVPHCHAKLELLEPPTGERTGRAASSEKEANLVSTINYPYIRTAGDLERKTGRKLQLHGRKQQTKR